MQMLLIFMLVGLSSTSEHWFIFDMYQFPGFSTQLFTLSSSSNNQQEQKYLTFTLSTYDRSILVDVTIRDSNGTVKQQESPIQLSIERADIIFNMINHMIFVGIRDQIKLETYVNCKLIDTYLFYSSSLINEYYNDSSSYKLVDIANQIEHYEITSKLEYTQQEIFDIFSCKPFVNLTKSSDNNQIISNIERPLIRKMQHVIETVQRGKLRSKRQSNHFTSSLTIVYQPYMDQTNLTNMNVRTIFNIPNLNFHIQYYPNEHIFHVRFNNKNLTEFVLYADKSTDRTISTNNNFVIFLHITPTIITSYINCEFIDQEFIVDTFYIDNLIQQIIHNHHYEYNRKSTLILFNKTIDKVAEMFFCLKLDDRNQDLLPDKYALRKFANALDVLANNLESSNTNYQNEKTHSKSSPVLSTSSTSNISRIHMSLTDSFGNDKEISSILNVETSSMFNDFIQYNRPCSIDEHCDHDRSMMICQASHCVCPKRSFWSSKSHRCVVCHDSLIGNRCFRLSSHKSTWHDANENCRNDKMIDHEQEYAMELVSHLNQTDIQYLKHSFSHNHNHNENTDYMYWIGAISDSTERSIYQFNYRTKRQVPTANFRWYDTHEIAKINIHDIWCSQTDSTSSTTINNSELCVIVASCGLYADDCERHHRFICEVI